MPCPADPVQPGRPVDAGAHAQDEPAFKDRYEQEEEVAPWSTWRARSKA